MNNFLQFLEEGRDAPLYHGTTAYAFKDIMTYNVITAKTFHRAYVYPTVVDGPYNTVVSLTRSLKFAKTWASHKDYGSAELFIFELDQRKLTQRHKLYPYNHFGDGMFNDRKGSARELNDIRKGSRFPINQYEENIIGDIKNLDRYITKIFVSKEAFKLIKNGIIDEKIAKMFRYFSIETKKEIYLND